MKTYSPNTEFLLKTIKYVNRRDDVTELNRYNFSPTVLEAVQDLLKAGKIDYSLPPAESYVDYENDGSSLATTVRLSDNVAMWMKGNVTHRDNDEPAYAVEGSLQWVQYGCLHRVSGPAIIREKHMAYISPIPSRKQLWNEPWHLFNFKLFTSSHERITKTHEDTGIPLEISFLLELNGINIRDWKIAADTPLQWQLKAIGKAEGSDHVDAWLFNKQLSRKNLEAKR